MIVSTACGQVFNQSLHVSLDRCGCKVQPDWCEEGNTHKVVSSHTNMEKNNTQRAHLEHSYFQVPLLVIICESLSYLFMSLMLLSGQINWSRGSNETGLLCSYPRGKTSIYSHLHQYVSPLCCHSLMLHKASFQSLLVEVMVKEMPSSSGIWRLKLFFLDILYLNSPTGYIHCYLKSPAA